MLPALKLALSLASVAPEIVRWVTKGDEKAVDTAQTIVNVAESITGMSGEDAVQSIKASPEAMLAFRQQVLELDSRLELAHLADVADARKRDVALAQAGRANKRANFMVAMDAIGLIVCLVVLALYADELRGEAIALISTVASIFGLCLRDAHQFEFGSSRGSREKDELMARLGK